MKEKMANIIAKANSLDEIVDLLIKMLADMNSEGINQIGFVSGVVTSEGPDKIASNIERLKYFTQKIQSENNFPIFSATDVFDNADLFSRIEATGVNSHDYEVFWRKLLSCGYITHMYMTPRWEISHGSKDEYDIAKSQNMKITYVAEET